MSPSVHCTPNINALLLIAQWSTVEFDCNKSLTVQNPKTKHLWNVLWDSCYCLLGCFAHSKLYTGDLYISPMFPVQYHYGCHRWGFSELWSLSWLSSSVAGLGELAVRCRPTIPENSDGSKIPFFTFTSSFSRAAAPCWPPFTRFHFILLFWNHTFTWEETQSSKTLWWFLYSHFQISWLE